MSIVLLKKLNGFFFSGFKMDFSFFCGSNFSERGFVLTFQGLRHWLAFVQPMINLGKVKKMIT